MTQLLKYTCITFTLLAMLLLAGCTEREDSLPQGSGVVSLSLHAAPANTGAYVDDLLDSERIHWYRVVITSVSDRTIIRCIDKVLMPAQEADRMDEIVLGAGSYNVYAFANISFSYLNSLGIAENGQVPADITTLRYSVPDCFGAAPDADDHLQGALVDVSSFAAAGKCVPMTGLAPQRIEVTSRINQTFNIEVRRLFAKLEFVFTNTTEQNLQVNSIAVSDMTTNGTGGSVLLMNYEENRNYLNLPYDLQPATLSHTFASPSAVNASGAPVSHSFYVLESRSSRVTNAFDLSFGVTPLGTSPSGTAADDMRYALTDPSALTLIHRNDWIVVPITFSRWQMRLEARSYPPIGGYAEAEIDEAGSDEFVVAFRGGGDFVIRPFIRKYYDGSAWFGIDDPTKIVGSPEIIVEDGVSALFINQPALASTGEIVGKMGVFPGRSACVTIRVKVIETSSPLVTKTLSRKIYITQL